MHLRNAVALASALTLAALASASAAPFSYTEGTDLGSTLPAASVFAFDVGDNTVSGQLGVEGEDAGADFDSFAFAIPSGTRATAIKIVTAPATQVSSDFFLYASFDLCNSNTFCHASPLGTNQFTLQPFGATYFVPFGSNLPLGPGTYGLLNYGLSANNGGDGRPDLFGDYTWTITLESTLTTVPEPTTLALLGLGLAGFALARRRWR